MDSNGIILIILIIALVGTALFSGGTFSFGMAGPSANPPSPDTEFGVIKERKSFFSSGPFGSNNNNGNNNNTEEPPPPTPSAEETRVANLQKYISISARNVRSRNPNDEYIQISYSSSAKESINISDWTVGNNHGESYKIGRTTTLAGVSSYNNQDQLILPPGGRVYIVTGRSPIGYSFRLNQCMEYYEVNYDFTPSITASCPSPKSESGQEGLSDQCYNYIRTLSACRYPTNIPLFLDNQCREFISKNATYDGCVKNHRNDEKFYQNSWWTYLDRPQTIWNDTRDIITVRDHKGIVIKTYSYN